jgi:hypothetical protein
MGLTDYLNKRIKKETIKQRKADLLTKVEEFKVLLADFEIAKNQIPAYNPPEEDFMAGPADSDEQLPAYQPSS